MLFSRTKQIINLCNSSLHLHHQPKPSHKKIAQKFSFLIHYQQELMIRHKWRIMRNSVTISGNFYNFNTSTDTVFVKMLILYRNIRYAQVQSIRSICHFWLWMYPSRTIPMIVVYSYFILLSYLCMILLIGRGNCKEERVVKR